jgi:integrase
LPTDVHGGNHPLVLFLADTGARLGEALALRWIDVDLEAGTARIARTFFPNFSGGMLIPEYLRNKVLHKIVRKALGEGRRFSPHDLRHHADSRIMPRSA